MPRRCVAANCSQQDRYLFEFPNTRKKCVSETEKRKISELRRQWTLFVKEKRAKWEPSNSSVLCYKHFTEDCILNLQQYSAGFSQRLMRTDSAVPTIHLPDPAKADATMSCTHSPYLMNDDDDVARRPTAQRPQSAFKKRENLRLIDDALSEEASNNEPSDYTPGDDLVLIETPVKDPALPVECKVAQVKSKDHPLKARFNRGVVPSQLKCSRKLSTEMSIEEEEASEQVEMTVADFPFIHVDMEHFSKEELNGNDLVIKEHDVGEGFLSEEMDSKNEIIVKEEKDVDEFLMDENECHVKVEDGSFDYIVKEEVEIDERLKEEPGGMPAEDGKESKAWHIEGCSIKNEAEEGL